MAEIIFGFISWFRGQRQNYSLIHLIFTECLLHAPGGPILWKLAYKHIIIMLYIIQKIYSDIIRVRSRN